jgi:hypothetical protein
VARTREGDSHADAPAVRLIRHEVIDPSGPGVNSYSRMGVVLRNRPQMHREEWFQQLGHEWAGCDNIARWRTVLRPILQCASRAELDMMMTTEERAALAAMHDQFEVWRGCYVINMPGLSWTVDRTIAERFPLLSRYRRLNNQPLLRRGMVKRARAVLKLQRKEAEIIAPSVFKITTQPIEPASLVALAPQRL